MATIDKIKHYFLDANRVNDNRSFTKSKLGNHDSKQIRFTKIS